MTRDYIRPIPQCDAARPAAALPLAGGWAWFTEVEVLSRAAPPRIRAAADLPAALLAPLIAPRPPIAGLVFDRPRIMGILNVTPDSFSDGGQHATLAAAVDHATRMAQDGADILDIGGESTRPGAACVDDATEIARTVPVIAALTARHPGVPLSIDTRKSVVARAALAAGAALVNDVSGLTHDPVLAQTCAAAGAPVCIMHMRGDPGNMTSLTRYEDVLLDVYDALADRIADAVALGIPRSQILADPGIGFAKTEAQNLTLLRRISLFHGLGVPLLLGVSRKRFIGTIGAAPDPLARVHGSVALAQAAAGQGVQVLRVHDVFPTASALALWRAVSGGA